MLVNKQHTPGITRTHIHIHRGSRASTGERVELLSRTCSNAEHNVAHHHQATQSRLCDRATLLNFSCMLCRLVLQQPWVPGMNGAPKTQENHDAWCSELDVSLASCLAICLSAWYVAWWQCISCMTSVIMHYYEHTSLCVLVCMYAHCL